MASKTININLKIWRQKNANTKGKMETYKLDNVSTDSSFLEMLDQLNEQLINSRNVCHLQRLEEEVKEATTRKELAEQNAKEELQKRVEAYKEHDKMYDKYKELLQAHENLKFNYNNIQQILSYRAERSNG
jgi:hypothetical protein